MPETSQSRSWTVLCRFMQTAISEGVALLHASSALPSTWMGMEVKIALNSLLCARTGGQAETNKHKA